MKNAELRYRFARLERQPKRQATLVITFERLPSGDHVIVDVESLPYAERRAIVVATDHDSLGQFEAVYYPRSWTVADAVWHAYVDAIERAAGSWGVPLPEPDPEGEWERIVL